MPTLATNKKVKADYQILEKYEAGMVLSGPEVKSVKAGQINLKGSYVTIDSKSQVWLIGTHIAKYKPATSVQQNYQADRSRRLLLKKKEIKSLLGRLTRAGLTIMPISVYTKGSLIKVEIAVVKGKKQYDKREVIKKREIERQVRRMIRGKYKSQSF